MSTRESQVAEFKESWKEEYLKTICAFANTQGGVLHIGKNDKGEVVGVSNHEKLLEDIPNQVKNCFGILADVKAIKKSKKIFISVKIKISPSPVSYRGKYYKRSGSTTQELNGSELQSFLLLKSSFAWESVIEENATFADIDLSTVERFKQLAITRFPKAALEKSVSSLLERLHLAKNKKLTRAAILLFGKSPQQFYPASYIKIGRFKNDATVISMDEVKGNLFQQVEQTFEILKTKYLHSDLTIDSLHRMEELEFPEVSLREAIVNAIVHRDYTNAVTQVKVFADSFSIWNNGELTSKLTVEKLKSSHPSFPRNQKIAEVFYNAGLIEQWGHGTIKMIDECKKAALPEPIFSNESGGMEVTFLKEKITEDYLKKLMLNERQVGAALHAKMVGRITNKMHQELYQTSKRTASNDLQTLVEKGILIKIGSTGKGTQYIIQRGKNGAKGAKMALESRTELDQKIDQLESELSHLSASEEVKYHFNKDIFFDLLDSWIKDLLFSIIPVTQKFNKLFIEPRHCISVMSGVGTLNFVNENAKELVRKLRETCIENADKIYDGIKMFVTLNYSTLRKGGLKTFGCTYQLEIEFDKTKYLVYMDEFSSTGQRKRVLEFERLLHLPLLSEEMNHLSKRLGDTIFQYIDFNTIKQGLRMGQ